MQKQLYDEMFAKEDTYWWHVAKRRLVQEKLDHFLRLAPDSKILDAGCGTGAMLSELSKKYPDTYGIDGSDAAVVYCRRRGQHNVEKANFEKKLPFANGLFDLVVCLDVVEHVGNDRQLIFEFNRILKKHGGIIITVPAYQFLWTYWDEMLGHKRRYSKRNLSKLISSAGFKVSWMSYFYSFLLPIVILIRLVKSTVKSQRSDFVTVADPINQLLLFLCRLERLALRLTSLPFGLSLIVIATKK